jgi:hypothetical protein
MNTERMTAFFISGGGAESSGIARVYRATQAGYLRFDGNWIAGFPPIQEVGFTRNLKPYFSKTDFAVCVRKNDKYCTASDLAFAVNATG